MIKKSITIILVVFYFNCNSQTLKTIKKIESSYQICLNKGDNMKGCSVEYYKKADILLNVAYKKLKQKLSIKKQSSLKTEQLEWLKKRDKYFQKVYSETKKEGDFIEGSNDFEMIVIDKKVEFVFERIKALIKRT